jgi:eukaryotic-like serine/threonine-protein kinase
MIGSLVAGRFQIEREAGAGGMGTVYRARDLTDGGFVALKVLSSDEVRNIERFEQEASILAALSHPGIVRYVARGLVGGRHFLAMEWLEGEALGHRIEHQPLSLAESLTVVRRTAEALGHAHEHGIIHRDIKPENLFLPGGRLEALKVLDFGVARLTRVARRLTRTGFLVGTPGYLAPEIISGAREITGTADFFSLGCVAFRCLSGRDAFEGNEAGALLAKIVMADAPRITRIAAHIPAPVADFVEWLLRRDPRQRPADAATLLRVLAGLEVLPDQLPGYGARRLATSLTLTEQRIVCLVMAGPPAAPRESPLDPAQGDPAPVAPALEAEMQLHHHTGIRALPDGSLVITLPATGKITDLAVNAVRAALVVRRHIAGVPIAVVTGQARAGGGGPGWSTLIDAAARLLRYTGPGQIGLQDMVAALVEPRFDLVRDGEWSFVQGERDPAPTHRKLLGKSIELAGRNRELASLTGMLATAVEESMAQAALVLGAPGIGKSRLLEEFLATAHRQPAPPRVLFAAGDAVGAGSPFAMLARLLRRHAGIRDGEPAEESWRKLAAAHVPRAGGAAPARRVAFLGEIARLPFAEGDDEALRAARANPQLMGDGMRRAFEDWLRAECEAQPVLLVLDDLHWGDSATVGFIDSALRNLREAPLMILALARPEVKSSFPDLWAARGLQQIALGPLSRKAAERLVREAMVAGTPAELIAELVTRSDGNPFYLEELIRAADAGRGGALPDSVLATVQARLDAEGEDAKRVLRAASIFGAGFSAAGLAALLGGEAVVVDTHGWLERMADRELIRQTTRADGSEDFAFAHALIRDAAYATLTEEDRVLGHRLAAHHLEQSGCPDPMTLAEHFQRGGEVARSVRWYLEGAEQALRASDLAGAISRADLGLAAMSPRNDPPGSSRGAEPSEDSALALTELTRGALNLIAAEAHLWRGEFPQAESRGTESIASLPSRTPLWYRSVAQTLISVAKQGKIDALGAWAERAAGAPPDPHQADAAASSAFIVCLAWAVAFLLVAGRQAQADELMLRIDELTAGLVRLDSQAQALVAQARATSASVRGDLDGCLAGLEAALVSFEAAGDARNVAMVRANIGFNYAELGLLERAEVMLAGALAEAERIGLVELPAIVQHNLGRVRARRGDLIEGERLERAALSSFVAQGEPRLEGLTRTYLSEIALLAGDAVEAERQAVRALTALRSAPNARIQAMGALARAYLVQGRAADALAVARQAAAQLDELGTVDEGDAEVRLACAESLAAAGHPDEARQAIRLARLRLLERAERIGDPDHRQHFLADIPAHARTIALARQWDPPEAAQGDASNTRLSDFA